MPDTEQVVDSVDTSIRGVTLSVTERPPIGTHLMCAPNAKTYAGGDVFFANTEPLAVEVVGNGSWPENLQVSGLDNHGNARRQTVAVSYLSAVAEHGSNPQWPVEQCTTVAHRDQPHFHLSRADGTDPRAWNMTVYQIDGYTTIHGRRFGKGTHVTVAAPRTRGEVQVGDVYRITSTEGGHGFDVGTEVRVAPFNGSSTQDTADGYSVYGTTGTPVRHLPWLAGTNAFVIPQDTSPRLVNCEFVRSGGEASAVAENRSTPSWPVRECTFGHPEAIHYHVTSGGDAFDPTVRSPMYNAVVHEASGMHTEQGLRYASGLHLTDWQSVNPETPETPPVAEVAEIPPPEEVLRRLVQRVDLDPDLNRPRASIETIRSLLDQITTARAAVDTARHERAEWLDRLIERSRVVADEQDWCGVYDSGMEELGLPTRADRPDPEPETETITVTATVEITVNFDDNDFDSWFENTHGESISSRSNSTEFTFTREVDTEVMVDVDSCGCDEDIDWAALLPDWVADNGYDWDIETKDCTND